MPAQSRSEPSVIAAVRHYWRELASQKGPSAASRGVVGAFWEFVRDSTPSRLRQRFGDADYDWDYRVNTTSGAVGWRDRLLGTFYSAYQPTAPAEFQEMLQALTEQTALWLPDFTFVDLGSGKGRTLLMASEYPFRRIIGVELLPSLNEIAKENLSRYKSESQKCFNLSSVCADAGSFPLPDDPLVIYLFNPFSETVFRQVLGNIDKTLRKNSRPLFLLYQNPQLEILLAQSPVLKKICGTHQYSLFGNSK